MNEGKEDSFGEQSGTPDSPSRQRSARSKLIRRAGCMVFFIVVVAIGVLIGGRAWIAYDLGFLTPHPSDAELITLLNDHKDEFEILLSMFEGDSSVQVVHPTWLQPDNAISLERWDEYRKIFKELGIDAGMRGGKRSDVWFIVEAKGLVTGGSDKGLIYRPEDPKPLYDSLDTRPQDLKELERAFRRIDDDWFITYSFDN